MKRIIRLIVVILAFLMTGAITLISIGDLALPDDISTYPDSGVVRFGKLYSVSVAESGQVDFQQNTRVSNTVGDIRLFGVFPVKSAEVSSLNESKVAVSGECFGIKLYTDGVIVVGTRDVETTQGKVNPASDAGIEKGDIIISINGEKMYSSNQVEEAFNDNNGKAYEVQIKRNGNYKTFTLAPVYSHAEGKYKVGIWVRDSTAGIGTITFYNQENSTLAALGHPITDVDTGETMPLLNGEAVKANVTKVYKSTEGEAGSLFCDFTDERIGTLVTNSGHGIYGSYEGEIDPQKLYFVAPCNEIERGYAQILCTVDENPPRFYDVEITRISYSSASDKNLVVKVTDPDLLNKTGGIVQGMSGSPIIQNGKLVGALTHVVVDNPKKGYGIFAEKMVSESNNVK